MENQKIRWALRGDRPKLPPPPPPKPSTTLPKPAAKSTSGVSIRRPPAIQEPPKIKAPPKYKRRWRDPRTGEYRYEY